ncbi:hypothetical protein [Actinomadura parmotrematis]|uniref:Uncharacterized protein n=1 Tax=Actinomadura parmotrematis TaxID=2864039 RepID=A0ABS7FPD9_9ACTN|nr:hypothetical protein [Actinomadura parmotrematis]MBW8481433.1 hypothetical protein [Actinomadura parmotrematis]
MLRLVDSRSGQAAELPAGRVLRVGLPGPVTLRALVVADVLARVAGRGRRQVRVTAAPEFAVHDQDWSDYGIRPFAVEDAPAGDLAVVTGGGGDGRAVEVAPVAEEAGWYALMANASLDPLGVRLALLEVPYGTPFTLTSAGLIAAVERLERLRGSVAEWATQPGRPLDRGYVDEAEAAFADDLDTPGVLAVLDRLAADPEVPPGAKLETVVHVDLLLGLDLVAAIGRA